VRNRAVFRVSAFPITFDTVSESSGQAEASADLVLLNNYIRRGIARIAPEIACDSRRRPVGGALT
jgi:hypothetical protein